MIPQNKFCLSFSLCLGFLLAHASHRYWVRFEDSGPFIRVFPCINQHNLASNNAGNEKMWCAWNEHKNQEDAGKVTSGPRQEVDPCGQSLRAPNVGRELRPTFRPIGGLFPPFQNTSEFGRQPPGPTQVGHLCPPLFLISKWRLLLLKLDCTIDRRSWRYRPSLFPGESEELTPTCQGTVEEAGMALLFLRPLPPPSLVKANASPPRSLASPLTPKLPVKFPLFKFQLIPPSPFTHSTARPCHPTSSEQVSSLSSQFLTDAGHGGNNNNDSGGSNNFWGWWRWHNDSGSGGGTLWGVYSVLILFLCSRAALALSSSDEENDAVWEVRGGKWTRLIPKNDSFIVAQEVGSGFGDDASFYVGRGVIPNVWVNCRELFIRLMLPEGFPDSVTSDYLDYSLWRGVQGIAAQISGVLATQVLPPKLNFRAIKLNVWTVVNVG